MTTRKNITDSTGRTYTIGAKGQILRGGLGAGESHLILVQIRRDGGADLEELKGTGIPGRKISTYLRYLERNGDAFFCYATNAWKSCEPRDESGRLTGRAARVA